ncbi:two-component sensor histidine kinase [Persicimonas caeni]|uniref:histidine kinase n=1 Tax=Persicimonas caeni TaxID=2292766 RepID=A0A4Y6Q0V2_PERCE|nr:ATP-binding protein [Persicimonas caeni]QDG54059.1 two-component sensor histidine kinase [Persicimonas caeni]QED35280.1 two-component sensor histidine kinase [Persicimonas caeni]
MPTATPKSAPADSTKKSALQTAVAVMMPALDQVAAIVVVHDEQGFVVACNRAFEQHTGLSTAQLAGERLEAIGEFSCDEQSPGVLDAVLFDADGGEALALKLRECSLGLEAGTALVGHPEQASLSELEDRLAQAQRLMDLGQLATGVAHELKNPLTSILNYADYLLDKYRGQFFEKRDGERLQRIVDGVERMDRFVRDLLQLARTDETLSYESVSVHEAVHSAVGLCAITLDSATISVTSRLEAPEARVCGVRSQLEQVFVNLITNGADAMPAGGGSIEVAVEACDGTVVCRITDDGEGMSESTRERIFEPFFTTRAESDGTGLGLALVRTIVDRHGGEICVESTPGQGTSFIVTLPLAD